MSRKDQVRRWLPALAMGLSLFVLSAEAQQPSPVTIQGVVGSGFFHQSLNQSEFQTAPVWGRLNINGYWGHPDFFTYHVSPSMGLGDQAPLQGFNFGNGFNTGFTLLRRRPLPLTFKYGKFYSPNQFRPTISGDVVSKVELSDWGLSTSARVPGLDPVRVAYEVNETRRETGTNNLIFGRDGKTFRVDTGVKLQRWKVRTNYTDLSESRDALTLLAGGSQFTRLERDSTGGQVDAISPLYGGTRIKVRSGLTRFDNVLGGRSFRSDSTWGEVNTNTRWTSRLSTSAFVRRNGIEREIELPLAGPGPAPPGGSVLLGITEGATTGAGGGVTVNVRQGLRFTANLARNGTDTTTFIPTGSVDSSSEATTGSTSLDFSQPIGRGNLHAMYSISAIRFDRTADPLFGGDSSRDTLGHTGNLGYSQAEVIGLSWTDAQFYYSRQDLGDIFGSLSNRMGVNFRGEKGFPNYLVAGSIGFDRTETEGSLLSESRSQSYAVHVRNTTWTAEYSRRQSEVDLPLVGLSGPASGSGTTETVSGTFNHLRRFPIRFQWLRSSNTLPLGGQSRYTAAQAGVQYQFRLLIVEAGIYTAESTQQNGLAGQSRTDVYVRIMRSFTLF